MVNVAVRVGCDVVEDVRLQGIRGLHDESVEIEPPEPAEKKSALAGLVTCNTCTHICTKKSSNIPFGARIFAHGGADRVDLLPALSPLVGVTLLGAHVDNLEIVSPRLHILFLVAYTVTLNGPLAGSLPLHDTASLVCGEDDDEFTASTQPRGTAVPVV